MFKSIHLVSSGILFYLPQFPLSQRRSSHSISQVGIIQVGELKQGHGEKG